MFDVLKQRWQTLSAHARVLFFLAVFAVLGLLVAGSLWLLRDDYQVLFADLRAQDAAVMVGELERMKIPYRLAENGTAILVEQDAVYKTRLKLMGKGIDLQGSVGLELFSNNDFGMTEFAQRVNYQRALQGELARTIMGFDEVKHARVHLVLPESGLFRRATAKPKASISMVMKGNTRLAPEQVLGIQRLVAAAVPEIDATAVTIVNQAGVALSKQVQDENVAPQGSTRLELKRQFEEYLSAKVMGVLDRAVGQGKAIVSVDATLNFDQVKVTQENVLPLPNSVGQSVGAVTRRRETQQGGEPVPDATQPGSRQALMQGSSSSEVEYVNGKRIEHIVSMPGGIRRLSVGVLVPDIDDPVELAKLREIVTMTAGINAARGDAIVLYNRGLQVSEAGDNGADKAIEAPTEKPKAASPSILFSRDDMMIVLGIGLFLLMAAVLRAIYRRDNAAVPKLSDDERRALLVQLQAWAQNGERS